LIAAGLVFGLATVAGAGIPFKGMAPASAYSYDIPCTAHRDHFTITNQSSPAVADLARYGWAGQDIEGRGVSALRIRRNFTVAHEGVNTGVVRRKRV
jgi:hypothetical protein